MKDKIEEFDESVKVMIYEKKRGKDLRDDEKA